ncbi:MAG: AMP-binding protein [Armatimonas sp.]
MLGRGERGEIVARGVNVMRAYFRRPDANADTFKHGWFRSGDEGFYLIGDDGQHYFFITGRLKELIIRGGVNYSPFEIDEILAQIPGVKAGDGCWV